jgi:uncharacterized membrane protein
MLALTCVGWLLFFIHHISQAISVNHIVDKIGKETEATICELMPSPRGVDSLRHAESVRPNPSEGAIPSEESGYIRFIDAQVLIVLAKQYHVTTQVEHSDPCRSANTSPCRGCRGLTPPSECALPGAHQEKGHRH